MTTQATKNIIKAALFTPGLNNRWGLPLLFEGSPGIGKSQTIESLSASLGLYCETLIASLREPTDFGGMPAPREHNGRLVMDYAPFSWVLKFDETKHGVVFIDEITTCEADVQKTLLRLILNGALGDHVLPPGVRFIAAANPVAEAAGGRDLTLPLANRFGHLPWEAPSVDNWVDWLIGGGDAAGNVLNAAAEEARVMNLWGDAHARAKGVVAGFLKARPELLFKMPKVDDPKASKSWPSPRSWDMAIRAKAGSDVHGLSSVEGHELVGAFIGQGVVGELITFERDLDLPNPADLLDKKVKFKHAAKRLDRTVAVLSSCTALVIGKSDEKQTDRAKALWGIIDDVCKCNAPDVTIAAAKALVQEQRLFRGDVVKAAGPALGALDPILRAAGVTYQAGQ